ncbi:bromodomain-containing protein [Ditylenchus destructor]|uniref:Bromodomain-containing protein n=1 Tax=Ditylenchus destructor TaxID=166010 RepID=A0AAD4MLD3_9BILA|nr:bromodomain-containing protein [Ditylenchus destructor]
MKEERDTWETTRRLGHNGSFWIIDSMTEREWLKAIEETSDEEDEEDNVKREDTPAKRMKTLENAGSANKRVVFEPNKHLVETLQKYYQTLVAYKTSDGRELADAFIQLPSRRELPDYYEVIEKPMDLNRIKKKIKDGKYGRLEDMTADVRLMCRNAQTYNEDGSDIFNDSVLLERVWERILEAHNTHLTSTRSTSTAQTIADKTAAESEESNESLIKSNDES